MYTIIKNEEGYDDGQASVSTRGNSILLDHGFPESYGGRAKYAVGEAKQLIKALSEAVRELTETPYERYARRINGFHVGTRIFNTVDGTYITKVGKNAWWSELRASIYSDANLAGAFVDFGKYYTIHGKPVG